MSKYERWNKMSDDYFAQATTEQLIRDSKQAGIVLTKKKATSKRLKSQRSGFSSATGVWVTRAGRSSIVSTNRRKSGSSNAGKARRNIATR